MLSMIRPRLFASSEDLTEYLVGKQSSAHYQIYGVLETDRPLDEGLLALAVKWAYEAIPVLNCQLVLDSERPYWKRRLSCNRRELYSMVETKDADYAIQSFMSVSLDPCQDALVQVQLVRTTGKDFLCVKISQVCCDAIGIKEYTRVLAEAYNALAKGRAFAQKDFSERRDLDLILEHFGVKRYQQIPKAGSAAPFKPAPFPSLSGEYSLPRWSKCFLDKNEYVKLKNYAAAKTATIHDVLLTAFSRAYPPITGQLNKEYSVIVTTDLRCFAPKICPVVNFSGSFVVNTASYEGESFAAALIKLSQAIKRKKSSLSGIHEALRLNEALRLSYADLAKEIAHKRLGAEFCAPRFCGTGFFSQEVMFFGEAAVTKAYILPPPVFAPGFLLLLSTYNNILTIAAGYYQPAVSKETMDILLRSILQELRQL